MNQLIIQAALATADNLEQRAKAEFALTQGAIEAEQTRNLAEAQRLAVAARAGAVVERRQTRAARRGNSVFGGGDRRSKRSKK